MKKTPFFESNKHLKNLLKKGVDEKVFPGAAAGVYKYSRKGEKTNIIFAGKTRTDEKGIPVKESTFFDLASLTKPLCTVLTTLHLIDKKIIFFDTPVEEIYGKEAARNLKNVTIFFDILENSTNDLFEVRK